MRGGVFVRFNLFAAVLLVASFSATTAFSQSFYPERLEDKSAVYLDDSGFGAHADGTSDDTAALQKAIDAVAERTRQGILFVPSGRYRITHTLYVWPGVRLIGYGAQRPVILLAPNTPGYVRGSRLHVHASLAVVRMNSAQSRGRAMRVSPFPEPCLQLADVIDANPGTFYSAMSNIDFDIGEGNRRRRRHPLSRRSALLSDPHDFRIGSGMPRSTTSATRPRTSTFLGGQYGIITGSPSPGWQFTLLDSTFDGQSEAAIKEHEAGLALVHDTFRNLPTAFDIEPNYIEELWIEELALREHHRPRHRHQRRKLQPHRDQYPRRFLRTCADLRKAARKRRTFPARAIATTSTISRMA